MSTLAEVQEAVSHLPEQEQKALTLWLNSRLEHEMTETDERDLLRSLDAAVQQVDSGQGVPLDIARDNPQAAVRFGDRLIDRVLILEQFPFLSAPYARRPGVRKLVSRPYIIYYRPRIEAGCVDILRYWQGARGESPL
jgi:plasmid stabilization system protein ParE